VRSYGRDRKAASHTEWAGVASCALWGRPKRMGPNIIGQRADVARSRHYTRTTIDLGK